jgi:fumarylpyruvate hydrolase
MTRRDLQMAAKAAGQPWEAAKAFDASAPITAIVPSARIGHPTEGAVWLQVNGVERQRSDLQAQIWSVAEVVSQLSRSLRLEAGDLIMTGTPPGVDPLQPGDLISAGIEGVAQLTVRVGARPAR